MLNPLGHLNCVIDSSFMNDGDSNLFLVDYEESSTSVTGESMSSPPHIVPERGGKKNKDGRPMLRIMEQPLDKFRFRYQSEMMGPHGSLPGRNQNVKGKKGCPVVELCNFKGDAIIKCMLVSVPRKELHPHKLVVRDQDEDIMDSVDIMVGPAQGGYVAGFEGMGIVHTAKKDIVNVLLEKYQKYFHYKNIDFELEKTKIYNKCINSVKEMDLNKVALGFTAHDPVTKKEICDPVYSETINNMKSAATGLLKIVDYSRSKGSAAGGEKVYMFVEKVLKKKIKVRFFNDDEEDPWEDWAKFTELDVHHQYGIVFRTPNYKDLHPKRDVEVKMELFRTSDGATSEPRVFIYKADPMKRKRPRINYNSSSLSSIGSSTGQLPSGEILPTVIRNVSDPKCEDRMLLEALNSTGPGSRGAPDPMPIPRLLIKARQDDKIYFSNEVVNKSDLLKDIFDEANINLSENVNLGSALLAFLETNPPEVNMSMENVSKEMSIDLNVFNQMINEAKHASTTAPFQFKTKLMHDNGITSDKKSCNEIPETVKDFKYSMLSDVNLYKTKDLKLAATTIRKLLAALNKSNADIDHVLEITSLLNTRMSNNDSILHVLVSCKQTDLVLWIVRRISLLGLPDHSMALNHTNNCRESILLYAVKYDLPALIDGLLLTDIDCSLTDKNGNTVIHKAVLDGRVDCLKSLLSVTASEINVDVNKANDDHKSPLLLCISAKAPASYEMIDLLLEGGCRADLARDSTDRNILHYAICQQDIQLLKHILERQPIRDLVNAVDSRKVSPLHLACVSISPLTNTIVKTILDAGGDPLQTVNGKENALGLAADNPEVLQLLKEHISSKIKDEVKIEEDDEEYDLVIDLDNEIHIKEEEENIVGQIADLNIPIEEPKFNKQYF